MSGLSEHSCNCIPMLSFDVSDRVVANGGWVGAGPKVRTCECVL